MTATDCLMLDAKHAILDEHHRKFQVLHEEGRLDEAMMQFHITVNCANDVLNDALNLVDEILEAHRKLEFPSPPLA
jgi:hypothetical protein